MSGRQGVRNYIKIDETVDRIATEIRKLEEDRSKLATVLNDAKLSMDFSVLSSQLASDVLEEKFSYEVKQTDLTGLRVAGIDGGIVARSYQTVDLMLARAVAVIFTFGSGGKLDVGYFPEENPIPALVSNLQPSPLPDFELRKSIERVACELQLAISLQDYAKVDLIVLDGSIVPQLSDRPPFYSTIAGKYRKVVELYETLYKSCIDTGTLLAGVIGDSRSIRYVQILGSLLPHLIEKTPLLKKLLEFDYRRVVQQTKDVDLLEKVLGLGERTPVFRYAEPISENTTFSDFSNKAWADLVNAFYLRTVEFDRPIRVEYLGTESNKILTARKIASVILPLSCHNAQYGIPSVLVEADARAKLLDGDIDMIFEQLIEKTGNPMILAKLRRERRPFR